MSTQMNTQTIVGWFNGRTFMCAGCDRRTAGDKAVWFPILWGRATEVIPDVACASCGEVF